MAFVNCYTYNYVRNINSATKKFNYNLIENYTNFLIEMKKLLIKEDLYEQFEEDYNYAVVRQVNNSFKKYFFAKQNEKKYSELKKEFKNYIKKDPYYTSIKEIKINKLSIKRKLMIFFVRRKMFFILKCMYFVNREKNI